MEDTKPKNRRKKIFEATIKQKYCNERGGDMSSLETYTLRIWGFDKDGCFVSTKISGLSKESLHEELNNLPSWAENYEYEVEEVNYITCSDEKDF
jgi:hypothetical protein